MLAPELTSSVCERQLCFLNAPQMYFLTVVYVCLLIMRQLLELNQAKIPVGISTTQLILNMKHTACLQYLTNMKINNVGVHLTKVTLMFVKIKWIVVEVCLRILLRLIFSLLSPYFNKNQTTGAF